MSYECIPTFKQWKHDIRELAQAANRRDRVLERISFLVKSLEKKNGDGQRSYLLCELYFSAKYWIRNMMPMIRPREHAAPVPALLVCVLKELERTFKCSRNMVTARLQQYYCCSENAHGIFCDEYDIPGEFRARSDLEQFKLYFVGRRVMWIPWWQQNAGASGLVPVNTAEAYQRSETKPLHENSAFFVLTRYRDMYAAPHVLKKDPNVPMYHSTIPQGKAVQFAGSIRIEDGKIKELCNDSGHYLPDKNYLLNVCEHLRTLGLQDRQLEEIEVYDYDGTALGSAYDVIDAEGMQGTGFSGIQGRKQARSGQRHEMGLAIKGRVFEDRLKALISIGNNRDAALEKLFAEQFEKVTAGLVTQKKPISARDWQETWKDILNSLSVFYDEGVKSNMSAYVKLADWLKDRQNWYQAHPPVPPRPKTPPAHGGVGPNRPVTPAPGMAKV